MSMLSHVSRIRLTNGQANDFSLLISVYVREFVHLKNGVSPKVFVRQLLALAMDTLLK